MTVELPTSDAAARKSTGRSWEDWFALLDDAGAKEWTHREIAVWIQEYHVEVSGWWAQNLTVGYERARGMREVHEKKDGFAASRSRTYPVDLHTLYHVWADDERRAEWLAEPEITVRGGTRDRSLNLDRVADGSRIRAWFTAKGGTKCSVSVQHERLRGPDAVTATKDFWAAALDRLGELLSR